MLIISDHLYDRCSRSAKSPLHALWSCSKLDRVWDAMDWDFRSWVTAQNFGELLAWIFENGKQADFFSITTWCIWQQRKQIRTQQNHHTTEKLARVATDWLEEYKAVQPAAIPCAAAPRRVL